MVLHEKYIPYDKCIRKFSSQTILNRVVFDFFVLTELSNFRNFLLNADNYTGLYLNQKFQVNWVFNFFFV